MTTLMDESNIVRVVKDDTGTVLYCVDKDGRELHYTRQRDVRLGPLEINWWRQSGEAYKVLRANIELGPLLGWISNGHTYIDDSYDRGYGLSIGRWEINIARHYDLQRR